MAYRDCWEYAQATRAVLYTDFILLFDRGDCAFGHRGDRAFGSFR